MKTRSLVALFSVVILAGCSTVDSRISGHRAAFDSWPPPVQQAVRAGKIDVGFTPEQVQVALGDPDRVFTRTAVTGRYEVWGYAERGPRFSFGVGMGSFHHGSGVGGGMMVGTGSDFPDEVLRVVFDQTGHVSSIEQIRRR